MKFRLSAGGTAAISVSADDVVPEGGVLAKDLIDAVANAYQFAVKPVFPPGVAPFAIPSHVFQSGVMTVGDQRFPILQLAIIPNGDVVTASTTEIADIVLDDFMRLLDRDLGYRFYNGVISRHYQSNIVVEFEKSFSDLIEAVGKIEEILGREISRPNMPFRLKRIGFGYGEPNAPMGVSIDGIKNSDFGLERRGSEPYERNRYFATAPVSTLEHIRILETIERELAG